MNYEINKSICPTCDGLGIIYKRIPYTAENYSITCPECNGTGYIYTSVPRLKKTSLNAYPNSNIYIKNNNNDTS
jgi:DnaJ-class molecular chaperone